MTNPITTTNNNTTTTTTTTSTTQKPTTMDNIKDKATNLISKVTGKNHTYTDHQGVVHQPDHDLGHSNQSHALNQGNIHTTGTSGTTSLGNPAYHGVLHDTDHQQNTGALSQHSGPMHTGAAMAGSAVPHGTSVDRAAYQQQQQQYNPNMVAPLQHAVPAGPTGTTNIPTFAQNVAPPAAGVIPTAQVAEVHDGHDHKKHSLFGGHKQDHVDLGLGAHQQVHGSAAGGTVPLNTNTGVQNTVPAMGAPGTTTAAGTHVPGEYNPNTVQPGVAQGNMAYDPNHRPVA